MRLVLASLIAVLCLVAGAAIATKRVEGGCTYFGSWFKGCEVDVTTKQ